MPNRVVLGLALMLAVWLTGCRTTGAHGDERLSDDLRELQQRLTGSFSSGQQARVDPEFYDIRLEMVPIWPGRDDGPWLYVEQAAASHLSKPYRQRVYQLDQRPDGALVSRVYTLPDEERYVGAWREPGRFADLTPAELELRAGCAMVLQRRADGAFVGGTEGTGCASTLRGARYATSQAEIYADRLVTWDRGYDAEGNQVWGARKSGYIFRRVD